jgi:hypothetical protein
MRRILFLLLAINSLVSCSKEEATNPPVVIPDIINGLVNEIAVTPINITTPDKGSFSISANNTIYKVDFNATDQAQSNATFRFASDTVLTDASREFANLGKDVIAYNPVAPNEIEIRFTDGRKVLGSFDANTSFGGVFGEALISQWRAASDPAKPNQKAKDDIINFVHRYADKDGPGPGTAPTYVSVTVSKP